MSYIYLKCGEFPQDEKGVLLLEEQWGETSLEEVSIHVTEQQAPTPCQNEAFCQGRNFILVADFEQRAGDTRTRNVINTRRMRTKL